MKQIRAVMLKHNNAKIVAAMALVAMSQVSVAEQYEVELKAQVGPYCVLPTPTPTGGSALSSITESHSNFTTIVGEDGKAVTTSATLIFADAYCNGSSTIKLESANGTSKLARCHKVLLPRLTIWQRQHGREIILFQLILS